MLKVLPTHPVHGHVRAGAGGGGCGAAGAARQASSSTPCSWAPGGNEDSGAVALSGSELWDWEQRRPGSADAPPAAEASLPDSAEVPQAN